MNENLNILLQTQINALIELQTQLKIILDNFDSIDSSSFDELISQTLQELITTYLEENEGLKELQNQFEEVKKEVENINITGNINTINTLQDEIKALSNEISLK
ncbi:DUF342 domain-containing protein, partial [Campylobacter sp. LR264d]|uniref:DUF342 domain-containing protein n=1 Tax=Campylobacter sp. LR264d TaxID=2593544 RepID=UPI00123AAC68